MTKFKFGWFGGGDSSDWWFGISPEGFGTVAMIVNFIVSITISNLTKDMITRVVEEVEKKISEFINLII